MNATKFTFDTVFADKRDVASDAAKARQRRSLTEGEIDKLCADAHAAGITPASAIACSADSTTMRTALRYTSRPSITM